MFVTSGVGRMVPRFLVMLGKIVSYPSLPLGMSHDTLRGSKFMGGITSCVSGGITSGLGKVFGASHRGCRGC